MIFFGSSSSGIAGCAVAENGDFNGDGLADLVIGASNDSGAYASGGAAYLILGTGW